MKARRLGIIGLLSACSSPDSDLGLYDHRAQNAAVDLVGEDEGQPDGDIRPTPTDAVDAPYPLTGISCYAVKGCESAELYASVSQAELEARHATRAIREFDMNRTNDVASYVEPTSRALDRAQALLQVDAPEALLSLALYLPDQFFDFELLRTADVEAHARLWQARVDQLAASQNAVRRYVETLGGKSGAALQLANVVYADVPAQNVETLLRSGLIDAIEIANTPTLPDANGIERRLAMVMNEDGQQSWGWDGDQGAKSSGASPVLFAVIEANPNSSARLNWDYLGFRETDPSISTARRVTGRLDCRYLTPCVFSTSATPSVDLHGTKVSSVLLSDFEDGQANGVDPGMSLLTRRRRGGIAPEGNMLYYSTGSDGDNAIAINDAVARGVDVINMSQHPSGGTYCNNDSFAGTRAAIQAAENAGVLVVVAAGNDGDLTNCRVNPFGAIPDTLTVAAIDDVEDFYDLATVPIQYSPATGTYSGANGIAQTTAVADGRIVATRMVDLAVTGIVDQVAALGDLGNSSGEVGTSFAAPQVAGAAGVLKDWIYSTGAFGGSSVWRNDPYVLSVMLANMGDGVWGHNGGADTYRQLDYSFGFGHLRFVLPSFYGDTHVIPLHDLEQGDFFEFYVGDDSGPEPTNMQGWKFAALIDADYYGNTPAITFRLIDKCPAGGGTAIIFEATQSTHKARMRMRAGDMPLYYHNRCLWVYGIVGQADGPFSLYMSEFSYAIDRKYNDM